MNYQPPDNTAGGNTPPSSKRELQIQGPRPAPLRVSKESHKIKKPPLPPPAAAYQASQQQQPEQQPQPLIIYDVSPKVIHATVSNFMTIVQRLTGPSSSDDPFGGSGDLSPAARFASIEKASPSEKQKERGNNGSDFMSMIEVEGVEMGQFPGILSPAPASLPPVSSSLFSPVIDSQTLAFLHDLSPFWSGNNNFMTSPSGFVSAPIVSPIPSPDLFNNLFDF
ncbi:protein MKS1 [Quillaja saponaria]|uniref:Protein MKS1 n=1 Tax=Quillaja saponaria TaxID=32244 RepID=A0AAD7LH46_QUISA|nr:protein MKS1 [Quillaja saponaria]